GEWSVVRDDAGPGRAILLRCRDRPLATDHRPRARPAGAPLIPPKAAAVDERRARIYDDLRGMVAGELHFEPLDRAPYAHDASLYEIDPLGVVVPRSEDEVVTVARYAAENRIPLHARGAGTDTGGGALGPGLVVDLSRHLRRVIALGDQHVVVEPGVVPDRLNAQLAPLGRRLEPISPNADVNTIGGM